MANDFTNVPSEELRRKIEQVDGCDHEALRAILKSDLANRGILVREADGNFSPAQQTASPTAVREDVFAQPGTPRFTQGLFIELRADSPEALAEIRRKFYEKFGKTV